MKSNTCTTRITAAAGTRISRCYYFSLTRIIIYQKRIQVYNNTAFLPIINITGSNFTFIVQNSSLLYPNGQRAVLSPFVVEQSLNPTKHDWLGKPYLTNYLILYRIPLSGSKPFKMNLFNEYMH
jgi:hypothetical protein